MWFSFFSLSIPIFSVNPNFLCQIPIFSVSPFFLCQFPIFLCQKLTAKLVLTQIFQLKWIWTARGGPTTLVKKPDDTRLMSFCKNILLEEILQVLFDWSPTAFAEVGANFDLVSILNEMYRNNKISRYVVTENFSGRV